MKLFNNWSETCITSDLKKKKRQLKHWVISPKDEGVTCENVVELKMWGNLVIAQESDIL